MSGRLDELPLLSTKLSAPRAREGLVSRARLMEHLGNPARRLLTLVSAPAGYGKTTLVAQWLEQAAGAASWLCVDEADNDPVRFLTYLIAALRRVDPRIGRATGTLLGLPRLPSVESLVAPLVNDLSEAPPFVLVLDDYHVIRTPSIHEMVEYLLAQQPPTTHLVLVTRRDPPFPLARLRALGQVLEVRARDLRFSVAEAEAFLTRTMGLNLTERAVAILSARTEGWPAGLQLAGLSLQGRDDVDSFVVDFGGSDRYVVDYLAEEVLGPEPESVRTFLRQTAILERLSAPLCDAVTGREDAADVLARLERANLFVVPLDGRREWYRYHLLFADVLRSGLDDDLRRALHHRAATWLASNGFHDEAVRHALDAGDWQVAARVIGECADDLLWKGEHATVAGWLASLPSAVVSSHVDLALIQAWLRMLTGQLVEAEALIKHVDEHLASDLEPLQRGKLLTLQAWLLQGRRGVDNSPIARRALDCFGESNHAWRHFALSLLGHAQFRRGETASATTTLREAYRIARDLGHTLAAVGVLVSLAPNLYREGRRREAETLRRQALRELVDGRGKPLPIAGLVLIPLGLVCYEADAREEARSHAMEGLFLCRLASLDVQMLGDGEWTLARLQLLDGEPESARATLRQARLVAERAGLSRYVAALSALETDVALRSGDAATAWQWAEAFEDGLAEPDPSVEVAYFTLVRVWLERGRLDEAIRLLDKLESGARDGGRFGRLVTIQVLRARVARAQGRRREALDYLAAAVALAAPEDYRRAILDEGADVLALLPAVRDAAPAFVDTLLASARQPGGEPGSLDVPAKGKGEPRPEPPSDGLIEPLSERERDILGLIEAGFSNAEIADRLVISLSTAKWHAYNLFGKLGVKSRTQALARARELKILDSR